MKSLSVVVPTYNERKRLPKTLSEIIAFLQDNKISSEIIISDSASTDGTQEFVKSFQSKIPIKFIEDKVRQGKGYGVKVGMLKATKDWVLFMDADNSTKIREIIKFDKYTDENQVIIGSRYKGREAERKQNIFRRIISRAGNRFIDLLTGLDFNDTQCGFKLFRRDAAQEVFSRLQTKGWGFDVEILLLAQKLCFNVAEVPVIWRDAEGSHLRAGRDSIKTFFEIIKISRKVRRTTYEQDS